MEYSFIVTGEPGAKQRPRVYRSAGGHVHGTTPAKTVIYENLVKIEYKVQVGCAAPMLQPPIRASIRAYFPIPASTSKRQRAILQAEITPYKGKKDADNIAKILLDALNQIAYADDSGVTDLHVQKRYGAVPRVEVTLTELDDYGEIILGIRG